MKLDNTANSNHYYVNNPRKFEPTLISKEDLLSVIQFAYTMCFGDGHHRNKRSGGQCGRTNGEKFCNIFQGKLAEIVLYNYFKSQRLECKEPDFSIYPEGIWDDSDLEINSKKINVKSAAFQSNLLLLETNDWNSIGQYVPNISLNNDTTIQYDYFILVRIQPDIKKLFKTERILLNNEIEKTILQNLIFINNWNYDIAGYCTNSDLVEKITNGYILPQNSILNHYTKMDANNYYIQSGDLKTITDLITKLIVS